MESNVSAGAFPAVLEYPAADWHHEPIAGEEGKMFSLGVVLSDHGDQGSVLRRDSSESPNPKLRACSFFPSTGEHPRAAVLLLSNSTWVLLC